MVKFLASGLGLPRLQPDADGAPTAYLFSWDTDAETYVLAEDEG